MAYFPFFIEVSGQQALIVGGGAVALDKIQVLLNFDVSMTVVAPEICQEIEALCARTQVEEKQPIICERRTFCEEDLRGKLFVIAATNNQSLNESIARLCKSRNILVNVVDDKEACGFVFPAFIRQDPITVAVSSEGTSPALTIALKEKIKSVIPPFYPSLAKFLGSLRPEIKAVIKSQKDRKAIYQELIARSEQRQAVVERIEAENLIAQFCAKQKKEADNGTNQSQSWNEGQ